MPLPLPMAHAGVMSPDGKHFAYNPLAPAFLFNFTDMMIQEKLGLYRERRGDMTHPWKSAPD